MSVNHSVAESREVRNFDRVVLSVHNMMNQIQITQGDHESLTVEARPEVLSKITTVVRGGELAIRMGGSLLDKIGFALSTSLTRPTIRYHLAVKNLASLELNGFVHASADELCTTNLSLSLKGAGRITIGSLTARHVATELRGAGRIDLGGQVREQEVAIEGPGLYQAIKLHSRKARVSLNGLGRARVWAVDKLEVEVRGLGRVEVRGKPEIKQDISPRAPIPGFGQP